MNDLENVAQAEQPLSAHDAHMLVKALTQRICSHGQQHYNHTSPPTGPLSPEGVACIQRHAWCARPPWLVQPPTIEQTMFYGTLLKHMARVGGDA